MTRALVVHPGTQHAFRMAAEFHRLGVLAGIYTGFAAGKDGNWEKAINATPTFLRRKAVNRRASEVPSELVHNNLALEVAWQTLDLTGIARGQRLLHWRNEQFQRSVPERALQAADVVIGFDTSSWILTQRCRELGRPLIMVQTIGHPDALMEVSEKVGNEYPNWKANMTPHLAEVRAAEQIEFDESTLIVGSSSFTRRTMIEHGVAPDKIRVVPHGVDARLFAPAEDRGDRPFRFVFVGSVSARKGVPLLIDAWRQLAPTKAELWLVGPIARNVRGLLADTPGVVLIGGVPGSEVPSMLRQCDVFVFPSYFEGFGLVILQAMACGLPVITTTATAGPDIFSGPDGGGWIVPTGELEPLAEAMENCLINSHEMRAIGKIARKVSERFSWQYYGSNWLPVLDEAVARRKAASELAPNARSGFEPPTTPRDNVMIAHPGTQYSIHLAAQIMRIGRLAEFHTGLVIGHRNPIAMGSKRLPSRIGTAIQSRIVRDVPSARIYNYGLKSLTDIGLLGGWYPTNEASLHARNERFQREIPANSLKKAKVVVGFDTSSWILAERVKNFCGKFVLDQSIGHPVVKERVFETIRERFPAWSGSIARKRASHIREEVREHELADAIVTPSRFVRETLISEGVPSDKIRVIPFGADLDVFYPSRRERQMGPAIFLFVGSISARKGVPVLLEAWRGLRPVNAELWLVGPGKIPEGVSIPHNVRLVGHKSRMDVAELMRQADAFVLPSFFEGLAQVQIEALASGLPVIGTIESGSQEIVNEGVNGFIIDAGDVAATGDRIRRLMDDPDLVEAMGRAAIKDREMLSWTHYGDLWGQLLVELS